MKPSTVGFYGGEPVGVPLTSFEAVNMFFGPNPQEDIMELPFDTREMKAADAVKAVESMWWDVDTAEALIAQEKSHPKGARKSVLAALEAKLKAAEAKAREKTKELLATAKTETPGSHMSHRALAALKERAAEAVEVEVEDGDETALDEVLGRMSAEDLAKFGLCRMMGPDPDDPMAPEEEGVTFTTDFQVPEAILTIKGADAPGSEPELPNVVLVTDDAGQIHEAVVVRAVRGYEHPIVVCIKDGTDETLMVTYDGDARTRMSWRPRP